jgi:hypothetical protein
MKRLTKIAVIGTCLSPIILYCTSASQALVSDGKSVYCMVEWHLPFYGMMRMPDPSWWTFFTRTWIGAIAVLPMLWMAVGLRNCFAYVRRRRSAVHAY